MQRSPQILPARDGEHLFYDGGLLSFKATGSQTDGSLLLFEVRMPHGKATPLHVHPDAVETFYIFEGEVLLHVDGVENRSVSSGSLTVIPKGTPHAFAVTSDAVHMLVIMTPASSISETFFRLAGEPADDPTLPSPPANYERFAGAVARSGLEVLGPPPFAATVMNSTESPTHSSAGS